MTPVKVLIVDDSAPMRLVIRNVVAGLGCDVRECDDGRDALDAYRAWRPDWVVMDVRMPGVDGLTATKAIRAEFPEARIVVTSIHREPELHEAAASAGAWRFLHKSHLLDLPDIFTSEEAKNFTRRQ